MSRDRPHRDRLSEKPEGSALILVLLLMLALSAIGMVALEDVAASIDQSGVYRVRTTAEMFGDGAANFWMRRSAGNANSVWRSMRQGDGCRSRIAGATPLTDREWRQLRSELGGCAIYDGSEDRSFGQILDPGSDETGLFTDDPGQHPSFESQKEESTFEVIARYPFEANAPSGFSEDDFCFKMVTVAAEGQLGAFPDDWDQLARVGRGRAVFKGKIGPVPCESQ